MHLLTLLLAANCRFMQATAPFANFPLNRAAASVTATATALVEAGVGESVTNVPCHPNRVAASVTATATALVRAKVGESVTNVLCQLIKAAASATVTATAQTPSK